LGKVIDDEAFQVSVDEKFKFISVLSRMFFVKSFYEECPFSPPIFPVFAFYQQTDLTEIVSHQGFTMG